MVRLLKMTTFWNPNSEHNNKWGNHFVFYKTWVLTLTVKNSQLNIICFFATLILSCSYVKIHTEKDSDLMPLEKVPQTIQPQKKQYTRLIHLKLELIYLWWVQEALTRLELYWNSSQFRQVV